MESVPLDASSRLWDRFFLVHPLVVVGTREPDGEYDLAPKHMAMPLGWDAYFGFVCTPRHATYHNAKREGVFTVSFPRPSQVVVSSLAATRRCGEGAGKPVLDALATHPAHEVDGVLLDDAYLHLECELDRVVDDFGVNSLIAGRVVAAHADERFLRDVKRDDADLIRHAPLLAYLNPGRFARISKSHAFPFPAEFSR